MCFWLLSLVLYVALTPAFAAKLWCVCNDHLHCQVPPVDLLQNITGWSHLYSVKNLTGLRVCESEGEEPHCYTSRNYVKESHKLSVHYGCVGSQSNAYHCIGAPILTHDQPRGIECCNVTDLCNFNLVAYLRHKQDKKDSQENADTNLSLSSEHLILLICASFLVILTSVTALVVCYRFRRHKRSPSLTMIEMIPRASDLHTVSTPLTSSCPDSQGVLTQSLLLPAVSEVSSGSGSGLPKLVPRTIGKEVSLLHTIGRGRFGEVYKGEWNGEFVAVKVFYTTEEASWYKETAMYRDCLMRHENVLCFIASDIRGTGGWTQLLLITEYHPLGSLHDFLSQQPVLTLSQTLNLLHSASSGLCYLHTEIAGSPGKPALAHRDIKSRNILVKSNFSSCIADLGLSVRYSSTYGLLDQPPHLLQGTKRYFCPEILSESPQIDIRSFDGFVLADMYAFALVMWECMLRCEIESHISPYTLPYIEQAPNDPSVELMRFLVVDQSLRPSLSSYWSENPATLAVSQLITECWQANPNARLTSLRVKKTLRALVEADSQQ